jgi:hypothetical protein
MPVRKTANLTKELNVDTELEAGRNSRTWRINFIMKRIHRPVPSSRGDRLWPDIVKWSATEDPANDERVSRAVENKH